MNVAALKEEEKSRKNKEEGGRDGGKEGDGEIDSEIVEDALVLTDAAHCKEPTLRLLLSLDTHTHTHSYKERETPLAYALKCVIRLSPSRF